MASKVRYILEDYPFEKKHNQTWSLSHEILSHEWLTIYESRYV